ncbi:MAG: insulinase family protein [Defluviitaleaceae bacterium]|nr:insulinase family protein [Defluviitaleaceae bacterium]
MEIITLKNGIRVILENIPYLRSVCLGIWVKNGSRHESVSTNGISHFMEHMLFKGTKTRTAKDIANEMDSVGGQLNAFTSKEYTCYYTRTLDTHVSKGLDILSDMFFNSNFDNDEIEKERNVIIEEINMYEDTPEEVASDLLQHSVWQNYPLGFSILGTKKSISSFNSDTFKNFWKEKYTPKNIVIAVAGNFKKEEIVDMIKSHFEDFEIKGDVNTPKDALYRPTVVTKEKDIEQIHLQLGFPSINLKDDNIYAMAALNTIFGGGMSSRLFQKIREENGLAYSVYSYNSSHEDVGLFSIYASLIKENVKDVLVYIFKEIQDLKIQRIDNIVLNRTKEQLKSNYILSLESSSSRMSNIGRSLVMLNRVLTPDQVLCKIESVTVEDVFNLALNILDESKVSLCAVGNIGNIDFENMLKNVI